MATQTQLEHYKQSVKHFTNAIEMSSTFVVPYIHRGDVYLSMGEFDLAIADFTYAFKTNPAACPRLLQSRPRLQWKR